MIALLRFHGLQLFRSRLVVLWVLFSVLVQFALVKLLYSATIEIQHARSVLGIKEIVVSLLYAQFFTGSLLATVYGIWVVPYLHEESRAPLTFALPVSKWVFPLVYGLSFFSLILLQNALSFGVLGAQFGFSVFSDEAFPWTQLASGFLLSMLSLEVMLFMLACTAVYFGKMGTFIVTSGFFLVLQVSAALFHSGVGLDSVWKKVYSVLPPFGEVLFVFSSGPVWEASHRLHIVSWVVWLILFCAAFRFRIGRA
jgi:hypothetical protein